MDFREISFAEILFSDERKPYSPRVIQNLGVGDYLYWKTEEKEGYVPEFDEVREEVEEAWNFQEARQLAREAADEHAANARNAKDQSLKDLFKDEVTELPEFTWLSVGGGNTPFAMMGGGIPELSDVFGVDRAGPEFMATAYSLRKGEIGVAPNSPKSTYYVIRVSEDGWRDDLKNQFLMMKYFMSNMPPQQRRTPPYERAAFDDRIKIYYKWMNELVESKGVKWIRDPQ